MVRNKSEDSKDWFFASDVDDTLLGNDSALANLAAALKKSKSRIIIAYNSSRPCASQKRSLVEHVNLPEPDYLIGALGTEIQTMSSDEEFTVYTRQFSKAWNRDGIVRLMDSLGFSAHQDEYQTQYKVSYHVPGDANYRLVLDRLEETGLPVKVIYSHEKNLDIIPKGVDKGRAVDFLRRHLGFETDQVVVAGDSANDRDMFLHPFKGIIVANADSHMEQLTGPHIYHSRYSYAKGVSEGLQHWGVIPGAF